MKKLLFLAGAAGATLVAMASPASALTTPYLVNDTTAIVTTLPAVVSSGTYLTLPTFNPHGVLAIIVITPPS